MLTEVVVMINNPEEKKLADARYAYVVKANELIQKSRFSLSAQQQKIILYLISQISQYDDDLKTYKFSIQEFCKVCGIDYNSGRNYSCLKTAIKELRDRSVWVSLDGNRETTISWINKAYIERSSGTIEIRLDEDLRPYLLKLRGHYTKYELIFTLHFKSKYTIRLYELVNSIHYNDLEEYKRTYSLDELRARLDAENYSHWMNFKARVLEPAIKEINNCSDKTVNYTPIKGRGTNGFSHVELTVKSKSSDERIKIYCQIEKELGIINQTEANQLSLFDNEREEII